MEKQVRTVHRQQLWEKQDPPLKQKAQQTQRTKVIRPEVRAVSWSAVDRRKHIEAAVCLGRRREQRLPALGVPHLQAETWRSWEQMVMPRSCGRWEGGTASSPLCSPCASELPRAQALFYLLKPSQLMNSGTSALQRVSASICLQIGLPQYLLLFKLMTFFFSISSFYSHLPQCPHLVFPVWDLENILWSVREIIMTTCTHTGCASNPGTLWSRPQVFNPVDLRRDGTLHF